MNKETAMPMPYTPIMINGMPDSDEVMQWLLDNLGEDYVIGKLSKRKDLNHRPRYVIRTTVDDKGKRLLGRDVWFRDREDSVQFALVWA